MVTNKSVFDMVESFPRNKVLGLVGGVFVCL